MSTGRIVLLAAIAVVTVLAGTWGYLEMQSRVSQGRYEQLITDSAPTAVEEDQHNDTNRHVDAPNAVDKHPGGLTGEEPVSGSKNGPVIVPVVREVDARQPINPAPGDTTSPPLDTQSPPKDHPSIESPGEKPGSQPNESNGEVEARTPGSVQQPSAPSALARSTEVTCIAISPDERFALIASEDKTLKLRDLGTGEVVQEFLGHKGKVTSVAFSADGTLAASSAPFSHEAIFIWNVGNACVLQRYTNAKEIVAAQFTANGRYVAFIETGARQVNLLNIFTGEVEQSLPPQPYLISALAVDPQGRYLATDGEIQERKCAVDFWDMASGEKAPSLGAPEDEYMQNQSLLAFDARGDLLVSASQFVRDGRIKVWDIATGAILKTLGVQQPAVTCLAIAPNGRSVVAYYQGEGLRLWNIESGEIEQRFSEAVTQKSVAFFKGGRSIITVGQDGILRIWDVTSGQEIK